MTYTRAPRTLLAPHPWDALPASPPAPGGDYLDALDPLPIRDALNAFRERHGGRKAAAA